MTGDVQQAPASESSAEPASVEIPQPTASPLVLATGLTCFAAGLAVGPAFLVAGVVMLVAALSFWIVQLLPGRGHARGLLEPVPSPAKWTGRSGGVEHLRPGMPGYRLRLPLAVHPISAGIKGGLVGGAVMPVPALLWGLISGHGIWYPINLLAGMALPGVGQMSVPELEEFHVALLVIAVLIHAALSVVIGLMYGVLMPTLPEVPRPIAWGGLILPLVWTGITYSLMGVVNPVLQERVDWPWFIVSQFVFGVVAAVVVLRSERIPIPPAGHRPDRLDEFAAGDAGVPS
jgi:hypothetical protein